MSAQMSERVNVLPVGGFMSDDYLPIPRSNLERDLGNRVQAEVMVLLRRAERDSEDVGAESFLIKALEALEFYQRDGKEQDPVVHHIGPSYAESGHCWRWKLYEVVAQLYGCISVHVDVTDTRQDADNDRDADGHRKQWYEQRLVGKRSAVVTTDLMYPWIVRLVRSAGKEVAKETGMSIQGATKRVAAALILTINGLVASKALYKKLDTQVKVQLNGGKEVVGSGDVVAAKYAELYPDHVPPRTRTVVTDNVARVAAAGIGIH